MNELRLRLAEIRSRYLRFAIETAPGARFLELRVLILTRSGGELGYIGYYSSWREFVLFPRESTVWSNGCLGEVKVAIELVNEARKEKTRRL
jgi:hypothetical protein